MDKKRRKWNARELFIMVDEGLREKGLRPEKILDYSCAGSGSEMILSEEFDVVLAPGLAFDLQGRRLGRGAGFYDRFLPKLRNDAFVVGLCYEEQIVEQTPVDNLDFRVHAVATPNRIVVVKDATTTTIR